MAKHVISDTDYLDLWKHFKDRADDLKGSMFQSVTWVVGFAAAVLGFCFTKFVDFQGTTICIKQPNLAVLFCVVGLVLCLYAIFLLIEFASHVRGIWRQVEVCEKQIGGIEDIVDAFGSGAKFGQIWHKMGVVVGLFAIGFIASVYMFKTANICST